MRAGDCSREGRRRAAVFFKISNALKKLFNTDDVVTFSEMRATVFNSTFKSADPLFAGGYHIVAVEKFFQRV